MPLPDLPRPGVPGVPGGPGGPGVPGVPGVTVAPAVRAGMSRLATAQPWMTTVVRLALAAVWGYAGYSKVSDPQAAVRAVRAYRLLPESVVPVLGYGLPFLEMGLAVLLALGLAIRLLGVVSVVMLLAFLTGVVSASVRGLTIDCGCFGGGGQVAPGATRYLAEILRDLGFLGLATWLVALPGSRLSLESIMATSDVGGPDPGDEEGNPPRE